MYNLETSFVWQSTELKLMPAVSQCVSTGSPLRKGGKRRPNASGFESGNGVSSIMQEMKLVLPPKGKSCHEAISQRMHKYRNVERDFPRKILQTLKIQ